MYKMEDIINKIHCADSIEFMKEIPDESIDLILTDPPYNISQAKTIDRTHIENKSMRRNGKVKELNYDFGEWDHFETVEEYLKWTEEWIKESVRVLKPYGTFYSFFPKLEISYLGCILEKYRMNIRDVCIWHKTNPAPLLFKVGYMSASEFFIFATKNRGTGHTFNYQIGQQHNVFTFPICMGKERLKDENGQTAHPTQKPMKLIELLIRYSSNERDIVLDPFMGSGTTAEASLKLNRNFIGIEKEQKYVDMANKRIDPYLSQKKIVEF